MKKLTKIRVGGVPEHFNLPWHLAMENGLFEKEGIEVEWTVFKGGTGQMTKALRNDEIDVCILLTEGIVSDIVNGNPSKLIGKYLNTPLIWGLYTGKNNPINHYGEIYDKKYAISRFGSGSHLMAIVNAYNQGWNVTTLKFKVVDNLQGGIDALTNGAADYFMWERFTTKPLVDNGTFRRIGNCPTPWPCFVIAVRNEVLAKHPKEVKKILAIINHQTKDFKNIKNIDKILAKRYAQKLEDIQKWLKITAWNEGKPITKNLITRIQNKMIRFNVIEKSENSSKFI